MDKAGLDEMNFRYNSVQANEYHKYERETNYINLPALPYVPCKVCGREKDNVRHDVTTSNS